MAKTIEAAAVHEFGKPVKFEEGRPADDQNSPIGRADTRSTFACICWNLVPFTRRAW